MSPRLRPSALAALGLALACQMPLVAQEPAPAQPAASTSAKRVDTARRVPAYFGQIGLTTEQRASIYGLQEKHLVRIAELEKQIDAQKAEMLAEAEGVLTETQKALLANLRQKASGSSKSVASVKPAK